MAETMSRSTGAPLSARLFASLPPPVKTTIGRDHANRAGHLLTRIVQQLPGQRGPRAWTEEALPVTSIAASIAAFACGRSVEVALWSR